MFNIRKIQEQVLYDSVKAASNHETAAEIVCKDNAQDNATWVISAMSRLESRFDGAAVRQIRMKCQCGYAMNEKLALVKGFMREAHSLDEFTNNDKASAAGLFCVDGELYLQFAFCPCPMLADVDKLNTYAWCQCTAGYSKVLFEKAFRCEVDVQLIKSIKTGDDICLMKIIPCGDIMWEQV